MVNKDDVTLIPQWYNSVRCKCIGVQMKLRLGLQVHSLPELNSFALRNVRYALLQNKMKHFKTRPVFIRPRMKAP